MIDLDQIPGRHLQQEAIFEQISSFPSAKLFKRYPKQCGIFRITLRTGSTASVFARNATDSPLWEHLEVSIIGEDRCPSWEEMDELRHLFWRKSTIVVQYHPKKSEYINNAPYCLHMWALSKATFPTPDFGILRTPFDLRTPIAFASKHRDIIEVRIGSAGNKWEFATVSVKNSSRYPTWEEMCNAKKLLWSPESLAVQFHICETTFDQGLAIWNFQGDFPRPDITLVGGPFQTAPV